ncbi:MAG: alanine--tRNA ligase [Sphingobacteriales bacterium]|nr:MAG: alanine--tRNA ligase [Sphingobacteriales bacterium]
MSSASEIRQQYLDFFKSKQHLIVPSAPIVVKNDPTLLFTNAGMNQFKDYFLGNKTAPSPRIADTQKCLRVSGKHNDLEEVGVDTYHHTMFEMLGNWSFGDYFKKDAIAWSWELLTEVYKLDKDKLYVTIFEGDEKEGLPRDEEAFNEWKKVIPEERILLGNKKDNFWEMGDTGPCGPCTEIHVDCRTPEERKAVDGATLVNNDHPQVIEIWNNVFIQFNRKKDGSLEPLPAQHVDTGMGFERLVRVLQGKQSNYDTDVFTGTIEATGNIVNKKYSGDDSKESVAFRVLADHIRAISFTIADGQLPSNTGAGYVIRRILRRAVRYYYSYLDYKQPLLHQLLPVIAKQFENVFPELIQQQDFVAKVIKEEEDAFLRTLDKGLKRIDSIIAAQKGGIINGVDAFELLDTFGFPIDLTRLIASENNLTVDEAGFEAEMQQQKNRSRAATSLETDDWKILNDNNSKGFVGYDFLENKTSILRYRKVKGKGKELFQIVLDETPFYAESGGQVGDRGHLSLANGSIEIVDTKKENDLIIHFAESIPDDLSGEITATVDTTRRKHISVHHSVTHLMHSALRKVLGNHVAQKGSLVNDEYLRFDFSHFAKVTDEELQQVEAIVNEKIRENIPVVIKSMSKDEAIALGATALFGEKYGDVVRVVMMDPAYSIELCGGTHVGSTGEIGLFKFTAESAVAAGVRRVEAVSGAAALQFINQQLGELDSIKGLLKNPKEIAKSIEGLQQENTMLAKRIESLEARQLVGIRNELLQKDQIIDNVSFIGEIVEVPNADALKKLCFDFKNHLHDHLIVLCANIGGKANVAVSISETVVAAKGLDAGKIIKETVSPLIKGGGGGQKTLATAGGQDVANFKDLIEKVKGMI